MKKIKNLSVKISVIIGYITTIIINFLSNSLPINNRTPADISESYPNLFAPAGFTFSIWGLIYLWLGAYVIYQFVRERRKKDGISNSVLNKINILFILTSIANISWIFAWHYDYIFLSLIIMISLLVFLVKIANILRNETKNLSTLDTIFIKSPFSVYFGWITVATIANSTIFLVSLGFRSFFFPEQVWAIAVLFTGVLIGGARTIKDKNTLYGIVLIWAYFGILIEHVSVDGWNMAYPQVIATVVLCIVILFYVTARISFLQKSQ